MSKGKSTKNKKDESISENACGVCGDPEDFVGPLESTCDGSMCRSCYQEHICECEICR